VFEVGFDHTDWHNGFEHDSEEAARVRVNLLRELAATRGRSWPLTSRSRPSAMSRSPATRFAAYRATSTPAKREEKQVALFPKLHDIILIDRPIGVTNGAVHHREDVELGNST
jgi:hypothetical protein